MKLTLSALGLALALPASAGTVALYDEAEAAKMAERLNQSVIRLDVESESPPKWEIYLHDLLKDVGLDRLAGNFRAGKWQGVGTGFFISADGYLFTNHHVVTPDNKLKLVKLTANLPDGRTLPARVIGADEAADVALLKVETGSTPVDYLKPAKQVTVGQVIYSLGFPEAVKTFSAGIVAAEPAKIDPIRKTYFPKTEERLLVNAWQPLQLYVKPGSSGSPVVNRAGEWIGIVSYSFGESNPVLMSVPTAVALKKARWWIGSNKLVF